MESAQAPHLGSDTAIIVICVVGGVIFLAVVTSLVLTFCARCIHLELAKIAVQRGETA